MLKKLELSQEEHFILKDYCNQKDIEFLSTPYDKDDAIFLHEKLNLNMLKTASADLIDHNLHEYIASKKIEVIISTGMADLGEIEETIKIYRKHESTKNITLLHCVANYPCTDASINIRAMKTLKQSFQCRVGYSDHSNGNIGAVLSIAFGAKVIEKHFTLDRTLEGPDHSASATPGELKSLVDDIRRAEVMLGSFIKCQQKEEIEMANISRKSIILRHNLDPGSILNEQDLALQRPGDGVLGNQWSKVLGRKLGIRKIAGEKLRIEDLE